MFMTPRDIALFLRSARTDASLARLRPALGGRDAFERVYDHGADPWASNDRRYRYQRRKYEVLLSLLPPGRRYGRALDLGCGLGAMARLLATRADSVLGLDVAQSAVEQARGRHVDVAHLRFEQADIETLSPTLDGTFDLIVLSDVLYYLSPLSDALLKTIALRMATLLTPGGICLLANHFFFAADPDSRMSRRIHRAFAWSPGLDVLSEHRRPFYLATLLTPAAG
jgi:SAM-dependent methyltransferase